jgi:hypothetical protein
MRARRGDSPLEECTSTVTPVRSRFIVTRVAIQDPIGKLLALIGGGAIVVVFGYFGIDAWRDYRSFEDAPRQLTMHAAVDASESSRQWVALRGGAWRCDALMTNVPGGLAFVPAIVDDGSIVVARFDHSIDCESVTAAPMTGVLETMDANRARDLRSAGLDLPAGARLRTLDVCDFCGRSNSRLGVIMCALFVLLGLSMYPLMLAYQRARQRGWRWLLDNIHAPADRAARARRNLRLLGAVIALSGGSFILFGQGYELDHVIPLPWAGAVMFLFGAYIVVFPEHYRKVSARSTRP